MRRDLAVLLGAPPARTAAVRLAIGADREGGRIALRPDERGTVFRSDGLAARLLCQMRARGGFWPWLGMDPPGRALSLPLAANPAGGGMLVFDARELLLPGDRHGQPRKGGQRWPATAS